MENINRIKDKSELARLSGNAQVLGDLLGLSSRRVYQLIDEGVFSKEGTTLNFVKSVHDYLSYVRSLAAASADVEEELRKEQVRLTKARADKAEIELLHACGEAVYLDDIKREWKSTAIEVRTRMLNLPERATLRIAGEKEPQKIKAILKDEVYLTLTSIAEEIPAQARAKSEAHAKAKSEAVDACE